MLDLKKSERIFFNQLFCGFFYFQAIFRLSVILIQFISKGKLEYCLLIIANNCKAQYFILQMFMPCNFAK